MKLIRKLLPALILAIIIFSTIYLSVSAYNKSTLCSELSDSLLRFRVLANSNSSADQLQKQLLSKNLSAYISSLIKASPSKEYAVDTLNAHLADIEKRANELAAYYGEPYPVSCSIGPHLFPYREYDAYAFPPGTYDTFLISIGEAKGSNWWCLAYPPLCFLDECITDMPDESGAALKQLLSPSAYELINSKEKNRRFTFRLFPFLNDIF